MIMYNNLKVPAIYKHFKNKYYATMGTSHPIKDPDVFFEDAHLDRILIHDTELNIDYFVYKKSDDSLHHIKDNNDKHLVIYTSLYDDHIPYGRDIEMFLSEVDKDKYPYVEQQFRMELFRY